VNRRLARFSLGLFCVLVQCSELVAQEAERPSLLVVGSAHFRNPGRDLVTVDIEDIMSPSRQDEIESFVELLARYNPTHIAVEFPASAQAQVDAAYSSYVTGDIELRPIEAHQIGYRLGKLSGHTRVYAVDWNDSPPGDPEDYDWVTFGQSNGYRDEIAALSDPSNLPDFNDMSGQTISEWLIRINQPATLRAMHKVYFDIALISEEDNQPGPNWVGSWYARNLKIFRNLVQIASDPSDRILAVNTRL